MKTLSKSLVYLFILLLISMACQKDDVFPKTDHHAIYESGPDEHAGVRSLLPGQITVIGSFNTAPNPFGITINESTNIGYISSFTTNKLEVYDLSNNQLITSIPVGQGPRMPAISPDGSKVVVPNLVAQSFTVIRTSDHSIIGTVTTGNFPALVMFPPNDNTVACSVTAGSDFLFTFIDVLNASVIAEINLPHTDLDVAFAISPDGTLALVTNPLFGGSGSVTLIDLTNQAILSIIPVSNDPKAVIFNSNGTKAWVCSEAASDISEIDIATRTVSNSFSTSIGPARIAAFDEDNRLLVVCPGSAFTDLYNLATGVLEKQIITPGVFSGIPGTDVVVLEEIGTALISGPLADELYLIDIDPTSPNYGTLIETLVISGFPIDIEVNPVTSTAYVSSWLGDKVNVLSLPGSSAQDMDAIIPDIITDLEEITGPCVPKANNAINKLQDAQQALAQNDLEDALQKVFVAMTLMSTSNCNDLTLDLQEALANASRVNTEAYIQSIEDLVGLVPEVQEAYQLLADGDALLDNGNYAEAVNKYRKAVKEANKA